MARGIVRCRWPVLLVVKVGSGAAVRGVLCDLLMVGSGVRRLADLSAVRAGKGAGRRVDWLQVAGLRPCVGSWFWVRSRWY